MNAGQDIIPSISEFLLGDSLQPGEIDVIADQNARIPDWHHDDMQRYMKFVLRAYINSALSRFSEHHPEFRKYTSCGRLFAEQTYAGNIILHSCDTTEDIDALYMFRDDYIIFGVAFGEDARQETRLERKRNFVEGAAGMPAYACLIRPSYGSEPAGFVADGRYSKIVIPGRKGFVQAAQRLAECSPR